MGRRRRRTPESHGRDRGSQTKSVAQPGGGARGPADSRRERPEPRRRARVPIRALLAWLPPSTRLESLARARWALASVLGLALLLRVAHLIALRSSPFYSSLVLDARYYDAWAGEIANGAWVGHAPAWVDPLYAYVLGVTYAVAGHHLVLARLLNLAFGVVTVLLVARLAERVWQSRSAAVLAALMAAACIPAIYFEGQTEKTALTLLLITAAAERFLAGSLGAVAAAGALTGLAALARGNALLFLPAAVLCLVLGWDREPSVAAATPRERGRRAAVFLGCALPVIALATLHNWLAAHEFVLTTTNLGVNLYLGNHTGNAYGYYERPDFLQPASGDELPDFRAEAQRRTGRRLSDREVSAYWSDRAWEAVKADPGLAAIRTVRKLRLTLHDDEHADNEDVSMVAEWSPVLRSPLFWMGQLLLLGVLGAVIGWPRRGVRIVVALTAIYLGSLLPFFVMARLRVQMAPLLCVLGGGAGVWLVETLRARDGRRALAAVAVLAPVAFLAYYRPDWMARRRSSELAIVWNNLGSTLNAEGKTDDAIRAYERAVEIDAASVPAALRALGGLYQARGDFLRAETAMRRVLELKPGSRIGTDALRGLYAAMLQDPRWHDDPRIRARAQALGSAAAPPGGSPDPTRAAIAQARSFGAQGRHDEAIRVLEDAVRRGPYDEGLHYFLGENMERHATPDEMIRFFSEELARDEKPQTSHYFWAVGLARRGDVDGAIAQLREALAIDPAHEMSQREWGVLLEGQGRPAEALGHFVEATHIHPDYRAAFEDAARVAAQLGRTSEAEAYRARAASADPNSIRRFVHWARYLHEHGRNEAAWQEIQRMLRERPADAEALQLRDEIRTALGDTGVAAASPATPRPRQSGRELSTDARAALIARLGREPSRATWIVYDGRDAGAQRLATQVASGFEEARWTVRSLSAAKFAARPGIFLVVAEQPSETTRAVDEALTSAGLEHTTVTDYREYSEGRRRADRGWQGAEFADGQEFVIMVGRQQ